jgi:hypothetical protein
MGKAAMYFAMRRLCLAMELELPNFQKTDSGGSRN